MLYFSLNRVFHNFSVRVDKNIRTYCTKCLLILIELDAVIEHRHKKKRIIFSTPFSPPWAERGSCSKGEATSGRRRPRGGREARWQARSEAARRSCRALGRRPVGPLWVLGRCTSLRSLRHRQRSQCKRHLGHHGATHKPLAPERRSCLQSPDVPVPFALSPRFWLQ